MDTRHGLVKIAGLLLISHSAMAVEVEGQDYDLCVAENTNICLNEICLTSEDLNCSQKCKQKAQEKCKQSSS